MSTLLVRRAELLVTMDQERREIPDGALLARDGWVEQVGSTGDLPGSADRVIDLSGHVLLPGFINTHHHLYQTLTRAVPVAQDAGLFAWLRALYPIWARLTPDDMRLSTQIGLAELALSGCTTAADHLYLYPNGCRLDDQIEAATEVGLRLHASRGSMSLGESRGGLPPDRVIEEEEAILEDTDRVIASYHDAAPGSRLRIVVAPCSPFSVTPELMKQSAELARSRGIRLHTHLAETRDEEEFCLERFGMTPLAYAEQLGWLGGDVWFAHAVHVSEAETGRMATAGTGVAHCPSSNMRLGSGIAPVSRFLRAGVNVGLGVDGSASNDGSHLLAEARQAMLMARLATSLPPPSGEGRGGGLLSPRTALEMATLGGAAVLGRDDLGSLEPGKCADFVAIDLGRLEYAGALHDPVAAVMLCAPVKVDHTYVHGRPVVSEGRLVTLEIEPLIERHNRAAARLVRGD
jgi:8-oxoguanine deaminase